jgi:hypothetical protein
MTEPVARRRTLAGWPLRTVGVVLLMLALAVWIGWATRTLIALQHRRIVSVSLATLVQDFVAAEARSPQSGDASTARTRAYLAAVDRAVSELGRDGTVVLVSEATLGRSVPDATTAVRREILKAGEVQGDAR